MTNLELLRLETSPSGTIGVLTLNKKVFCFVLEPPKKGNERGISCIPTGQYNCRRYDSPKFGVPCLGIHHVHGREYISIHYGNTLEDTNGCLIVGAGVGFLDDRRAVLGSKTVLTDLVSQTSYICNLTISEFF